MKLEPGFCGYIDVNGNPVVDGNFDSSLAYVNVSSEDRLLVFLNGAINRKIKPPPIFQRKTWLEKIPYTSMVVPDKTVEINDSLELGWYLGEKDSRYIFYVSKYISDIARGLNIKNENIVLYGSSGGGYAALLIGTILIGSSAIVINPQVYLKKYIKRVYDKFILDTGYDEECKLLDVTKLMQTCNYIPPFKYIQNIIDHSHYTLHYLPFLKWYSDNSTKLNKGGVNTFVESCDKKGHSGVPNVIQSLPYIIDVPSPSSLYVQRGVEDSVGIYKLSDFISVYFFFEQEDDRIVVCIKSKLSSSSEEKLLLRGWMLSEKLGLFRYIRPHEKLDFLVTWDFSSIDDEVVINLTKWYCKGQIRYSVSNQ